MGKKVNKRKADKSTTIMHIRKRLERAQRLWKSSNYIKDLEKSIVAHWWTL